VERTLQQLAHSLRIVCSELRPPTLIPFGLKKAILAHVEELRGTHPDLEIYLDLDFDGQTLSEQSRLVLYRIYQEAMHNILRHAQARRVWVRFQMDNSHASLEVRDDGVGFTVPDKWLLFARQGHLGLVGAVERVKEVGGEIEITAVPGEGTRIWTAIQFQALQAQPVMEEI
jgi:signal transduction histidine kinase